MVVYKITNIINNKIYIGKTVDFKRRCKEYRLRKPIGTYNTPITRAIYKYGIDSFMFDILIESDDTHYIDMMEKYFMLKFNTLDECFGYNRKFFDNSKLPDSTKELMSKASVGFKHTHEHKISISKKIIAESSNEIVISDSSKLFGDYIGSHRSVISRTIKRCGTIKGYTVKYYIEGLETKFSKPVIYLNY